MKQPIFTRDDNNPILSVEDMPFPAGAVLNPGATEYDGDVLLLLRVEKANGFSDIHVARSADGRTDWRVDKTPLLQHNIDDWKYETWGCEDARVCYLDSEQAYYITYTAYSPYGAAVGIARTTDFESIERLGLIFAPNNKDAALFPRKFNGKWAALHRPDAGGIEHIWIASSPDLTNWGQPHCVLTEGAGPAWDAIKVGAGPPPMLTDEGWLLMYHGVKAYGGQMVYRVGLALLDADQPHKIVARCPQAVFIPSAPYEKSGLVPNVVFPTGWILRDDEVWMYYGAADSCVCLATAKLQDLIDAVHCR